jgi:hypothetical protein
MDKLGCEVTSQFFKCKPCSKPASGFFDTKLGVSTPTLLYIGTSRLDPEILNYYLRSCIDFVLDRYVRKPSYDAEEERRHNSARDDPRLRPLQKRF